MLGLRPKFCIINIQCLPKVVVAIFSDWEELRMQKKRRHAMLKLLCFLNEGSTNFEGGFRWGMALASISGRYNESNEFGCGLRVRFGPDGGSGGFATGHTCTEERRWTAVTVSVDMCLGLSSWPKGCCILNVGGVRFLGVKRLLSSICTLVIWS